jgi:hypothetical protein
MTAAPNMMIEAAGVTASPDTEVSVREVFGLDIDITSILKPQSPFWPGLLITAA